MSEHLHSLPALDTALAALAADVAEGRIDPGLAQEAKSHILEAYGWLDRRSSKPGAPYSASGEHPDAAA